MATFIRGKNPRKPYTIRYFHEGRQRERSFSTAREARDFKAKFEHDSREQIFVDPRTANTKFAIAAGDWLAHHRGSPKTRSNYEMALRLHILPEFGGKPLAGVALDRSGVEKFLHETLPANGLGVSMIRTCGMVLTAIVNDAIERGKLTRTRLRGIDLPVKPQKAEIPLASPAQMITLEEKMPEPYGFTIRLMLDCGLRIGEALGWQEGDCLRDGTLRVQRQLSSDGTKYIPLKHRREGDYRDVPAAWSATAVPYRLSRFPMVNHRTYRDWFNRARDAAGLPKEFTPHTLRHIFASRCLAEGIPITDVSHWLGHKNIQVTYGIYGHLMPASWERARKVLEREREP